MADVLNLTTLAQSIGLPLWAFYIAIVWSLFWKATALWKSARQNQPFWFVVMLLINTIGILEILYIFLFSKIKFSQKISATRKTRRKRK